MTDQAPEAAAPRRRTLWLALAATLLLCLWTALQGEVAPRGDDLLASPNRTVASAAEAAGVASEPASATRAIAEPVAALRRNPWAALSPAARAAWSAPVAASAPRSAAARGPAPITLAAAPQAPAPPFTLIGRYVDGQGPAALLATPQRTLVVRPGELADPQWRVDAVAAQRIELTWLPGAQKRSLAYPPGT